MTGRLGLTLLVVLTVWAAAAQAQAEAPEVEPRQVRERRTSSATMYAMQAPPEVAASPAGAGRQVYTNQFVLRVRGGELAARKLARKHGFVYLKHILDDFHHLEHQRLARRSLDEATPLVNSSIQEEPEVLLLERQVLKRRVKRDFLESPGRPAATPPPRQGALRPANQARGPALQLLRPSQQTRPANQAPAPAYRARLQQAAGGRPARPPPDGEPNELEVAASSPQAARNRSAPFNDPSWPLLWYLDGGARNGFDLNVVAAWRMGFTGKGIVITILDDGLEKDHPDLQANYDPLASFDINGDDADPMPRYDANDSNRHGTRCAGEVAAVPDNHICSVGIAYNSKVGGVRMLDGDVTDAVEARSLGLNNQHIHIYSASWGPDDNGKTVDGPGELATRAFIEGVSNGRQGLGSIFVFASGNGGREHDNCNCDGYTNSIWTLSISSATENGLIPWYISGSHEERQIATTDLHHSCTSSHTGTSASAPLAAGICALVLESNPRLSWRDMQHIVVRTAKPANLVARDWRTNALGRNVSHAFGYGLMDAAAMILMAQRWTTVPVQYTCEVRSPQMDKQIPAKGFIELKLRAECANVRFLEHVQSKVTLAASRRGDLHIYLVSPHGTRSTLLAQRPNDQAEQGFRNWPFMTVHSWGESPNGVWTLEVHNDGKPQGFASLKEWTLILYGTSSDPNRHLDRPAPPAARPATTRAPPAAPPVAVAPVAQAPDARARPAPPPPLGAAHAHPPAEPPGWSLVPSPVSRPTPTQPPPVASSSPASVSAKSSVGPSAPPPAPTPAPPVAEPQPARTDFEVVTAPALSTLRPPLLLLDNNKLDAPPTSGGSAANRSTPTQPPAPAAPPAVELDSNQIDLRLSKDYRSSGDQAFNSLLEPRPGGAQADPVGSVSAAKSRQARVPFVVITGSVALLHLCWLLLVPVHLYANYKLVRH